LTRVVDFTKRRWKAISLMTVLFLVGIAIGASGGEPQAADVENVAAPVAKTTTVEGEPVTVTETETVKKRVVKWKTRIKRVTRTVTETVVDGGGGGGGGGCHPSYKGECLDPTVSDYDCASGMGNGPGYVFATVRVVGPDDYDLDRDGNGLGCE
jgi:hypothetical protein